MGYGSGSLMRFLRHAIPNSQHEAIELDPTVVEAATEMGLVDPDSACERLAVGDALEYTREATSSEKPKSQQSESQSPRFDGICIDVFDGANLMPPGFYAVPFLERLREEVLEQQDCSFVIHNFHIGTERLEAQLEDAITTYRTVFGTKISGHESESDNEPGGGDSGGGLYSLYKVDSLNTNNHGGNTILIAILNTDHDGSETSTSTNRTANTTSSLLELASLATERWDFTRFNVASRIAHAKPL